jgi:uncharacterized protein YbjT (DUF2867 family)
MSLLVIGGTGTLGRQIVLQALTKGYQVRCLVRNFRKASFLKEWGAELVYGDLSRPETIPPCFKGITAVIDASTSRANELDALKKVDWEGKLCLIEASKVAKVQKFIFFSAQNVDQFQNIPLMKIKNGIEIKLRESGIPYTTFRLTGFYQGLIEQYAIPILENLPIWVTNENTYISYMDTQDIAKFCLRSLQIPQTENQTFLLSNSKEWVSSEIINLCEQLAGQEAKVQRVPLFILKVVSQFFGFFEWGQNISDRLAFAEILNTENNLSKSTFDLYKMFKIDPSELVQLDDYFLEYFIRFQNMGDTNIVSGIVKILEPPESKVVSTNTFITQFRVQFPQFRKTSIVHLTFWGNLAGHVAAFYKTDDYILIEGYISLRTKRMPNKVVSKSKKIEITVFKIHPLFLS